MQSFSAIRNRLDEKMSKTQYDGIAEQYATAQRQFHSGGDPARDILFSRLEVFASQFPLEERLKLRICDAGCGFGAELEGLHSRGYRDIHGFDESPNQVRLTKELMIKLGFKEISNNIRQASFEDTGFPDCYFDAIISRYAFHYYMLCLDEVFTEAYRILKPGGHIIFVVQHPEFDRELKKLQHPDAGEDEKCDVSYPILGGRIPITRPTFTMKEWENHYARALFRTLFRHSSQPMKEYEGELGKVPYFMAVDMRKREEPLIIT